MQEQMVAQEGLVIWQVELHDHLKVPTYRLKTTFLLTMLFLNNGFSVEFSDWVCTSGWFHSSFIHVWTLPQFFHCLERNRIPLHFVHVLLGFHIKRLCRSENKTFQLVQQFYLCNVPVQKIT